MPVLPTATYTVPSFSHDATFHMASTSFFSNTTSHLSAATSTLSTSARLSNYLTAFPPPYRHKSFVILFLNHHSRNQQPPLHHIHLHNHLQPPPLHHQLPLPNLPHSPGILTKESGSHILFQLHQ